MAHSCRQNWCNWVRFVGLLARGQTLTLLSLSYFATISEVCFGSLPFWKTHLRPSLLMSWHVASIYPLNFPSSLCHRFCEVHQPLLQQSTPTAWCRHPHVSLLAWCSSACKPHLFSPKYNNGRYGQTVQFLFNQTRGQFSKIFVPMRTCKL